MSVTTLAHNTMLSPSYNKGRNGKKICRITPHCVVGQCPAVNVANWWLTNLKNTGHGCSSNYVIGKDGELLLVVDEADRSWCSSSADNDYQAVTIECASDLKAPYAMNSKVYNKLVELCVDICRRNGKKKLLWIADKDTALAYQPKDDEMLITIHAWFANKDCPGAWLVSRLGNLAEEVTRKLGGVNVKKYLYRVQLGAYSVKLNATAQLAKVKKAGFSDAFITKVDKYYRVQVGAFSVKNNAYAQLDKVKKAGFTDAFIKSFEI